MRTICFPYFIQTAIYDDSEQKLQMADFINWRYPLNRQMVIEILPWIAELCTIGKITREERNELAKLLQHIPDDEAENKFKEAINGLARICPCTQIRTIQMMMNRKEVNNVHLG